MSDVVGTGTVAFSRGEDRPRGVDVTVGAVSAGRAVENSYTQPEALLGSRSAHGAGHRGVSRRHQHHPPARPPATLDQFPFTRPDRRIRRFTGHTRLGQEPRFEILHSDQRVLLDDGLGPDTGVVGVLPGRLLRDPSRPAFRLQIALRRCVAFGPAPAGPRALRRGQLRGAATAMAKVRQVEPAVGGGRGALHTPVHTNARQRGLRRFGAVALDHEGRVPVTEVVLVDPHAGRLTRQLTGPDDRDRDLAGQTQPIAKQIESRSSRLLRQQFPHLKSRMPTLWTNSYFVATTGGATLEVIKKYVENQRNV